MQEIPSKEQIREELHRTLEANPTLKKCANCIHYNPVTGFCDEIKKAFPAYMYGCRFHITAEEKLIEIAHEELKTQARECEKIEFLLAMALTAANTTTLFVEDFERRVKAVHNKEKERTARGHLKKDLDLADQMKGAFKKIYGHLEKIEQQYRFYIQPHLDKVFTKEGVYNAEGHDQFQSDAGEFATFLLEMARVAHHNADNANRVYELMRSMRNENAGGENNTFCLDDKDIGHYRLKG